MTQRAHNPTAAERKSEFSLFRVAVNDNNVVYTAFVLEDFNQSLTMSLSFVSKTVQTCTEDGNFTETAIENKETSLLGINRPGGDGGPHKPLFEQLRANQEQEEAERQEYQQSIMRGTLALDEEDCAHLDALQRQRAEQQNAVQKQTLEDLQAFRAAQADRLEQQNSTMTVEESNRGGKNEVAEKAALSQPMAVVHNKPAPPPPLTIVAKKRRRGVPSKEDDKQPIQEHTDSKSRKIEEQTATTTTTTTDSGPNDALGSLLTCYGSSSDED
jgi:FAM192A/Fyv6, N-terminal domain